MIFPGLPILLAQLAEIAEAYLGRAHRSESGLWEELVGGPEDHLDGWWALTYDDFPPATWILLVFSECPVGQDFALFPFCDLDAPLEGYTPSFL